MELYKDKETRPCIRLELTSAKPSIFESKVGGVGYIPHDRSFPVDNDGNQLRLLAQIECEKVQLDEFPKKGLLQFWILNDEVYGLDFDNPTVQNTFRVIYYPEIDKTVTYEEIMSKYVQNKYDIEEYSMPVFSEYGIEFSEDRNVYMSWDNDDYDNIAELGGNQLGGIPYFTQTDPREYEPLQKYDYLLFQLDTCSVDGEDAVMWGDSGIGNFFIETEKLKKLDFSDVLYNWDCC